MKMKEFLQSFSDDAKLQIESQNSGGIEFHGTKKEVKMSKWGKAEVKDLFYCEDFPGEIGISVIEE